MQAWLRAQVDEVLLAAATSRSSAAAAAAVAADAVPATDAVAAGGGADGCMGGVLETAAEAAEAEAALGMERLRVSHIHPIINALTSVDMAAPSAEGERLRLQEVAVMSATKRAKTKKPLANEQTGTGVDMWVQKTCDALANQGLAPTCKWLQQGWTSSLRPDADDRAPEIKFAKECAACVRTRCHHKELFLDTPQLTSCCLPPRVRLRRTISISLKGEPTPLFNIQCGVTPPPLMPSGMLAIPLQNGQFAFVPPAQFELDQNDPMQCLLNVKLCALLRIFPEFALSHPCTGCE